MRTLTASRLRDQTTLSLTDRAAAFVRTNPDQNVSRHDLGDAYRRVGVTKKQVRKAKANPRKYTPAYVAQLRTELRDKVLAADAEDRWLWNVDEMHFKLTEHIRFAWALPGDQPSVPINPVPGQQTASVVAATCVRTGEVLYTIGRKFQKADDINAFLGRVCAATPPDKKVAVLLDNASSHKARLVKDYAARVDVALCFNVPYHPQWNGIENVFADVRDRYRRKLTDRRLRDPDRIQLVELVSETFDATLPQVARELCLKGWRNLLCTDADHPETFQGHQLRP